MAAEIDAYPNRDWADFQSLPLEARAAQTVLEARGNERPGVKDPLMAIPIPFNDGEGRRLIEEFGPFSIQVELMDDSEIPVAGLEDQGASGWAFLTEEQAQQVRSATIPGDADFSLQEFRAKGLLTHWTRNIALVAGISIITMVFEGGWQEDVLATVGIVLVGGLALIPVTRWQERRTWRKKWEDRSSAWFFASMKRISGSWPRLGENWVLGSAIIQEEALVFKKRLRLIGREVRIPLPRFSLRSTRPVSGIWETIWVNPEAKVLELQSDNVRLLLAVLPDDYPYVVGYLQPDSWGN